MLKEGPAEIWTFDVIASLVPQLPVDPTISLPVLVFSSLASILVAAIYVAAGIAAVALTPPPNENPVYDGSTPEGGLPERFDQ